MSVSKKRRLSPEASRNPVEDARILFLWNIQEASRTHRLSIFGAFGKTFGETDLKTFEDAVEDLSAQYLNDVTSLYDAFAVELSVCVGSGFQESEENLDEIVQHIEDSVQDDETVLENDDDPQQHDIDHEDLAEDPVQHMEDKVQYDENTEYHDTDTVQHDDTIVQHDDDSLPHDIDTEPSAEKSMKHVDDNTEQHDINTVQYDDDTVEHDEHAMQHDDGIMQQNVDTAQHNINEVQNDIETVQYDTNTDQVDVDTVKHEDQHSSDTMHCAGASNENTISNDMVYEAIADNDVNISSNDTKETVLLSVNNTEEGALMEISNASETNQIEDENQQKPSDVHTIEADNQIVSGITNVVLAADTHFLETPVIRNDRTKEPENVEIATEAISELQPQIINTVSETNDSETPEIPHTSIGSDLPNDDTNVSQEHGVSYVIEGDASNEYIQNIAFEEGDLGGERVMYLTMSSNDTSAGETKGGNGTAPIAIRYIQTQDQEGNIVYTQAEDGVLTTDTAQVAESDPSVQHIEYIQMPDGNLALASGDQPMVIEYTASASEPQSIIELTDAMNAGVQYTAAEALPREISELQNLGVSIKQEVDPSHLLESDNPRSLLLQKKAPVFKNRPGPPKKKFDPFERSLLDQLDIKGVVCTEADKEEVQPEEKDLAKAQLLGETEKVANLEFTVAPKFPKVRKRKALEPGETKGFRCELCGDILYTQNALTKHKNRVHPEHSEHTCCICYKFCSNKKDLRSHFYNAHNKHELCTCPVCGFSYTTHGDFKDHLQGCTFTPEDLGYKKPVFEKKPVKGSHLPFKCKFCSMGFVRKGTLTHHIVVKHLKYTPGSSNSCEVCEKRFLDEYSLLKHFRTKSHLKNVKETYGSQSDAEEEDVKQAAHGFTNIAAAPEVKKRGTREQNSFFICYICGQDFNRESSLNIHIAKHKKAFECDVCGHKLDSKAQLVVHQRIHTGDTPFVCDLCGKGMRSNKHLYQHKKQMHSDVAYKCATCGSVFKQLSSLYQHIRKKHGEKAYEQFKKDGARSKLVPLVQSGINR